MQVRAGQTADPVVGVIRAGIAEHLRAGRHALPELLWKCGQRGSDTPRARRPFDVNATVTQRLSWSTEARMDSAECTFSLIPASHARPPQGLRKDRNSYRPVSAGARVSRMC